MIGTPTNPDWGCIIWVSSLEDPPHVAVWFSNCIKTLRPGYCQDIIDHWDVLVISLGLGADSVLLANIYSDAAHTAINLLHERVLELPKFHLMCSDFNVHSSQWDPEGPENNIYADCLEAVAEWVGLSLSSLEVESPTYNGELWPMVIDLMFVPDEEALVLQHTIIPEDRGTSDHAPLAITISAPRLQVPATWWAIHKDSDEEVSFLEDVASGLQPLLEWEGGSIAELESIVNLIASIFN